MSRRQALDPGVSQGKTAVGVGKTDKGRENVMMIAGQVFVVPRLLVRAAE
jgi:hypothetical protein